MKTFKDTVVERLTKEIDEELLDLMDNDMMEVEYDEDLIATLKFTPEGFQLAKQKGIIPLEDIEEFEYLDFVPPWRDDFWYFLSFRRRMRLNPQDFSERKTNKGEIFFPYYKE